MAHFAKVVDNIVVQVIVAEPEFFDTFVDTTPGQWIQYSYNVHGGVYYDPTTNEPLADQSTVEWTAPRLRKNPAGVGAHYDPDADVFYPPRPYSSWVLDTNDYQWKPPYPMPDDGLDYTWSEVDYQADNTQGWVQISE
jgi:hypothetical protein